jgi:hypothetical protein
MTFMARRKSVQRNFISARSTISIPPRKSRAAHSSGASDLTSTPNHLTAGWLASG